MSTAYWIACRTSGSSNGGRELFSNITVVRVSSSSETTRLSSPSNVARLATGSVLAICASPVCSWVARVAPSTMNRASAESRATSPPQYSALASKVSDSRGTSSVTVNGPVQVPMMSICSPS